MTSISDVELKDVDARDYLRDMEISRAYELRPGAIYAIKCDTLLSQQQFGWVEKMVAALEEKTGCKFIVLEKHFDLVEPPEKPEPVLCGNGPAIPC